MTWPLLSEPVSPDGTLGVLVIATAIAAMLYGITILQAMQYYDRFYNDPRVLKFLVGLRITTIFWPTLTHLTFRSLYLGTATSDRLSPSATKLTTILSVFETVTIVMEIHALYYYAVSHGGTRFSSIATPSSLRLERSFSLATVYLVQMALTVRMQQLRRQWWWVAAMLYLLATGAVVTGLVATVQGSIDGPSRPAVFNILSCVSAGLQIAVDTLIAVSLYWLNRRRAGSLDEGTFRHFFVSAVNRGVFSMLLLIVSTVTYFVLYPLLFWVAFRMLSSKVHAISLLSTYNTRTSRDGVGHDPEILDARLRERLDRELGGTRFGARLESPPNLPSIAYGLPRSPSAWFTANKSTEGTESWSPSYHARSTTAVDSSSGT
ncbi:hypothetical protein C8Q80DRAFT_1141896 [Daedaleopsis nitida]|nr:hypothetical protein C8Q80DRAFT_1141896 [Daedaleopsis nitida]